MLLTITSLSSCDKKDDTMKKYNVVDGEVIIDDESLTSSTSINDNYRVFYEIFTGSFSDSNNDGIGDLRGIINRLDYLNDGDPNSGKSLGVQGIWLTPIFASPTYHKYDASDYYKIDSSFGTMDDLKELIDECHNRNIKIILDLVLNHTGNYNPWFNKFIAAHKNNDVDNQYYDYYCYFNTGEEQPAGRAFSKTSGIELYYEANFSSNMPELNYDNQNVRNDMLDIAKYYLDMGIDGFRFDAAKYIYYGDDAKSAQFWQWYISELKKYKPDIYTVGEVWSADALTYPYFEAGLDCFSFSTAQASGKISSTAKNGNVNTYTKFIEGYLNQINELNNTSIMRPFIANHDTDRAAGFIPVSTNQMHMAANLYLLCSGSPFIYYGEEIGMKGSRGSAQTDADRRLAMLWGDGDTIKNPKEATYNSNSQTNGTVSSQIGDELSLYNHYKKLIMIRNAYPEIARGSYTALKSEESSLGGFEITYNNEKTYILHNTSNDSISIDLSSIIPDDNINIVECIGKGTSSIDGKNLILDGLTSIIIKPL